MPHPRPALPTRLPALLLALLLAGGAQAAPALKMLVFPSPGLYDEQPDGSIGGPGGALLAKITRASGVHFDIEAMPIPRALSTLQAQPLTCVAGMARTPDRESRFQWVGPVSRADLVVYGREEQTPPAAGAATLQGLRGMKVVAIRDTVMAQQLREQGVAAQEVSSALTALRMLQAQRVDYWYAHQLVAEAASSASGGPPIKPLFSAARIDGYLACHPEVPAATVDGLRQGLQRLRRQGELAEFGLR